MKLYASYFSFVRYFYSFYFDIGDKIATILLIFQEFRDKNIIEHPKLLRAKVLDIRFLTWHFVLFVRMCFWVFMDYRKW